MTPAAHWTQCQRREGRFEAFGIIRIHDIPNENEKPVAKDPSSIDCQAADVDKKLSWAKL
jgi:hypothetical protein